MTDGRMEYVLEGLSCASCAAKIEKKVNEIDGVKTAALNFVTKTLTLQIVGRNNTGDLTSQVERIVKSIEPDVAVLEINDEERGPQFKDVKIHDKYKIEIVRLIIGTSLFGTAVIFDFSTAIELLLFFASYVLTGTEVLFKAVRNIFKGQVFDENFLMSMATLGAFAIRQYPEGAAVMLFYQIGEFIQDIAVNRSRRSIAELMDIRPDYANLIVGDELKKVSPEEVGPGEWIMIKPGERVPLDGRVVDGRSTIDTSALTGESLPREVETGCEVLSGSINKSGLLTLEVTKYFRESTVAKILELVQNAAARKAPTENFITKFARYYTPAVVIIAAALACIPPIIVPGAVFSDWLYRGLVFLVISCPCALVISIPLGFFGGIGGASKKGILVKGSNYLEALNNVDIIVFDKTGTLTKGVFKVSEVRTQNGFGKEELLEFAAFAECYSSHPIAVSIINEYGKEINKNDIIEYQEIPGLGINVKVKGRTIMAGNARHMKKEGIQFENIQEAGTAVYIAIDGKYAGSILISDEVKNDAREAILGLKKMGVQKTVMLTGDSRAVAESVSKQLGIDEYYAELLPNQKVEEMEILEGQKSNSGKMIFVGDGLNDAPVLARADIGIAMGGLGTDAAIEAADIVIMTDEPSKIVTAMGIARRTKRIVWQNIIFSLGIKVIVLALGAVGLATIWEAVFADVGVMVIAVLNSMRVIRVRDI